MLRTIAQSNLLHKLLNETGLTKNKPEMVYSFTEGRTHSTAEMSYYECQAMIDHLRAKHSLTDDGQRANNMRRKIISICHQLGWYEKKDDKLILKDGKPVIDMVRINEWCIKYSHQHKGLNAHSVMDLRVLVTQFERVLSSHLKKQE